MPGRAPPSRGPASWSPSRRGPRRRSVVRSATSSKNFGRDGAPALRPAGGPLAGDGGDLALEVPHARQHETLHPGSRSSRGMVSGVLAVALNSTRASSSAASSARPRATSARSVGRARDALAQARLAHAGRADEAEGGPSRRGVAGHRRRRRRGALSIHHQRVVEELDLEVIARPDLVGRPRLHRWGSRSCSDSSGAGRAWPDRWRGGTKRSAAHRERWRKKRAIEWAFSSERYPGARARSPAIR